MNDPMPADLDISPPRRSFWRNLSAVWIVPLLALILSLGVAWKSYSDLGVLISITFTNAAGVKAGETTLRYRDVVIGTVEKVSFNRDLTKVIVATRVTQEVADTLPPDAQFWVVRPTVTAQGVSGLSTVLSGVYIDAAWTPIENSSVHSFTGIDDPPLVRPGLDGSRITIRARDGNMLAAGAPVFYRGIQVGNIETPHLASDGASVVVDAFIQSPHDALLTTASRFWDLSGFSVSLGPGGLTLDVGSLSALVTGGIAFDSVLADGKPVSAQTIFDLFPDEATARDSVFNVTAGTEVPFAIIFDGSINGLATGAAVQYRGLKVGDVTSVSAFIDRSGFTPKVRLRVTIGLVPQSLGLLDGAGKIETENFVEEAVTNGLRARLTSTSIFSSSLVVELVDEADAQPATMLRPSQAFPIIPTTKAAVPDLQTTAEGVLDRINKLPVEDVMNHAISLMASIEALTGNASTQAVPDEVLGLIKEGRTVVTGASTVINDPTLQSLPAELSATVSDLRAIIDDLKTQGALDKLVSAIDSANVAAANLAEASDQVPALMQDLRDLAAKANSLPAEELIASANQLMTSANALIDTDATRALPADLSAALGEVQAALSELRAGGAVENLNGTLASARTAADSVAEASKDLPALANRLDALATQANGVIASYGARSDFNAETLAALREVENAARAVAQLARTIERNPNSLLLGR